MVSENDLKDMFEKPAGFISSKNINPKEFD